MLTDGIGRGTEEEEDLDPKAARQFLTEPARLLELASPLVQKVRRRAAWKLVSRPLMNTACGMSVRCQRRWMHAQCRAAVAGQLQHAQMCTFGRQCGTSHSLAVCACFTSTLTWHVSRHVGRQVLAHCLLQAQMVRH